MRIMSIRNIYQNAHYYFYLFLCKCHNVHYYLTIVKYTCNLDKHWKRRYKNMAENIQKRNIRQNAWQKENKDRINFLMDKGTKDRITLAAEKEGINSSEFIRRAIEERLYKFGFEKKLSIEDPSLNQDQEHQEPETPKI